MYVLSHPYDPIIFLSVLRFISEGDTLIQLGQVARRMLGTGRSVGPNRNKDADNNSFW